MLSIIWTPITTQEIILIVTCLFIGGYTFVSILHLLTDRNRLSIERTKVKIERAKAEPIISKLSSAQTSGKWLIFSAQNLGAPASSIRFTCDDSQEIQVIDDNGSAINVWERDLKVVFRIKPKSVINSMTIDAMNARYSVTMHYRNALDEPCEKLLIFQF